MFSGQIFDTVKINIVKYMTTPGVIFSILKAVLILAVALAVVKFGNFFISRIIKVVTGKERAIQKKIPMERVATLTWVFKSFFDIVVWTLAILTILPEFEINIVPLLASLGIVGLAISMGAKNLIQDYLAGIVILIEDQYRVGERIEAAGKTGEVRQISLRRTILFEPSEKKICYIPNSEIKTVVNLSRSI